MPYTNKEQRKAYAREWVAKRRAEFFADKSCYACGETENLELDHLDPSKKISHNIWSWSAIRRNDEIAKCDILCYSCHKLKTLLFDVPLSEHGTNAGYNKHGYRCDLCRAKKSELNARRKR